MSAVNPEQFEQLPMFMPVQKVMGMPSVDAPFHPSRDAMWDTKLSESRSRIVGTDTTTGKYVSLHEDIRRSGVLGPVNVVHGVPESKDHTDPYGEETDRPEGDDGPVLGQGHHRTAVLHDLGHTEVPVIHRDYATEGFGA